MTLEEELADLTAKVPALEADLAAANKTISELQAAIVTTPAAPPPVSPVVDLVALKAALNAALALIPA